VDVNVHPNKADVRFASNQVVYGSLYSVVSSVLDGTSAAIDIVKNYPKEDAFQGEKRETATVKPLAFTVEEKEKSAQEEIVVPKKPLDNTLFEAPKREEPAITYAKAADGGYGASSVFDANLQNLIPPKGLTSNERDAIFAENQRFLRELDTKKQETKPIEPKQEQVNDSVFAKTEQPATISVFSHANYVGQAFKTYLIFEMEGVLYFVDQHAAHERMIYDKLLKQMKDQAIVSQPMLFPYHLTVNPQEERFIKENLEVFNELGIEIQEFGLRTYRVSAVPADLVSMDLGQFFAQTLKDAEALNGLSSTDIRKEKLMQAACKSAIKAGFSITEKEIDLIGEKLSQNPGLTCPHGRPVAVKVSKTELEKWFKRIV